MKLVTYWFYFGSISYLSKRGGAKRITALFDDITDFYSDLELCKIEKFWHLEQVFTGRRYYLSDIALLAYYLGISINELLNPVKVKKEPENAIMKLQKRR